MGKGRLFSDNSNDEVYQSESNNENFVLSSQQNAQGLGGGVFNDSSGYGNFLQSGRDQRNADLDGALFRGNLGFLLDTAVLDVETSTINLLEDASGTPLPRASIDKIVFVAGGTGDLITILGAQRTGQRLRLYNIDTQIITIKNTGSAIDNTIFTPGGSNFELSGNAVVDLTYDITTAKWRVVGGTGGGGTGISFPILYPKVDLEPAAEFNQTIDLSIETGNAKQIQFPAGNIGLQIIGDPTNTVGEDVYVLFIQDSVGDRKLSTVDSAIKNGALMDTLLDKAANARTLFRLATLDGGTSYHATLVDLSTAAGGLLSTLSINTDKDWAGRFITNIAGFDLFANSVANNITNMGALTFVSDAAATRGQFGRSDFFLPTVVPDGLVTNIPNTQNITWTIDGTEKFQLDGSSGGKLIANVDLDMNTFDIRQLDRLRFVSDSNTPATPGDPSIYLDAVDNMVFNINDQKQYFWTMFNKTRMQLDQAGTNNDTILTVETDSGDASAIPKVIIFRDDPTPQSGLGGDSEITNLIFSGTNAATNGGASAGSNVYSQIITTYESVITGREASSVNFFTSFDTGSSTALKSFLGINNSNSNEIDAFVDLNMNDKSILQVNTLELQDTTTFGAILFNADGARDTFISSNVLDEDRIDVTVNGALGVVFGFSTTKSLPSLSLTSPSGAFLDVASNFVAFAPLTEPVDGIIVNNQGLVFFDTTTDPAILKIKKKSSVGAVTTVSLEGAGGGISFPITPPVDVRGNVSTNQNIVLTDTDAHSTTMTLTGDIDITFSGFPSSGTQIEWEVQVTQDATGGRVITWDSAVTNPPVLGTTAGSIAVVVFRTNDGGSTVRVANTVTTTSGSSTLGGLDDVTLTAPVDNNFLAFDTSSSLWINQTASEAGVAQGDLNNLSSPTSINQDLLFSAAGKNIGTVSIPVDQFFVDTVRLQNGLLVANRPTITSLGGNSVDINHPTGSSVNFSENAATAAVIIDGGGLITSNNLTLQNILTFNDNTTDPLSNGQFARNSTDVKVFSGGAVRNLSNIGVVSGGANVFLSNLTSPTSINQDLIPQSGKFLGTDSNPWSDTTSNKFTVGIAGSFANTDIAIIADESTGMEFMTPNAELYSFFFGGTTTPQKRIEFGTSTLKFVSGGTMQAQIFQLSGDLEANPITLGQFSINGSDVLVFSGGLAKNLSDIGTGVFLPLAGGTMTGEINFGGQNLNNVDDINFSSSGMDMTISATIFSIDYASNQTFRIRDGTQSRIILDSNGLRLATNGINLGFFGEVAIARPSVSGDTSGNVALENLLIALDNLGLITDST